MIGWLFVGVATLLTAAVVLATNTPTARAGRCAFCGARLPPDVDGLVRTRYCPPPRLCRREMEPS